MRLGIALSSALWLIGSVTFALDLPHEQYQLSNGLKVLLVPEPGRTVGVVMNYDVGSANDPPHYRGLAHLTEHVTFRGSRHLQNLEGPKRIDALGGAWNAVTGPERTDYLASLPSEGLETVLWIESERMAFALDGIDERAFALEKRIVINEYEEHNGGLSSVLWQHQQRQMFGSEHAFAMSTDDVIDDTEAISLAHMQWFFQRTYRPDNATLVLVGAFDPAQVKTWITRYFGAIVNPPVARLPGDTTLPKLCGVHRVELGHKFALGEPMAVTWTLPRPRTPLEFAHYRALRILLDSRLEDQLVRSTLLASSVSVALDDRQRYSLLTLHLERYEKVEVEKVEAELTRVIERLARAPLSSTELAGMRAMLRSSAVFQDEDRIAHALRMLLHEELLPEVLPALDSASIQHLARGLLGPRVVVSAEPGHAPRNFVSSEKNPCQ